MSVIRGEILIPFILTFALSILMPSIILAEDAKLQLIEKVEVDGRLVTLGDLILNAADKHDVAVFRAPDLGTTGHVSVSRILAVARKHDVNIRQKPTFKSVTISRASRVIEVDELKRIIREQLQNRLSLDGKSQLIIKLPADIKNLHFDTKVQGELTLSKLNWSQRSGKFTAFFELGDITPIVVRGSATLMVEIAVPKSTISAGTTLTDSDFEMKQVRLGKGLSKGIASLASMTGLAAKRRLQAGKPVLLSDLETPKLIHKNQLVTILLEAPGLIIRTEGKALADAAQGETVRVLNTQSKRIIHATAKASGLVSVSLSGSSRSGS